MHFRKGGSAYVRELIEQAVASGTRTAVAHGDWEVDCAVRIPSDFALILEDCHLRLADGCFSNIFVNEHNETEMGRTVDGADRNIAIIGRGRAILDGGEPNGLCEKTPVEERKAPLYKNNLILFTNVDGFRIEHLSCHNQRWWALNFIYCANGYIGNIDFCANDAAVDSDGNVYHGLIRKRYKEALVKNADGVDLRAGCHDIVIENITGFTQDDTIALTGLNGSLERVFGVETLPSDICNVTIRNVRTAAFCTNVRLLNQGDVKLHDIEIDGVYDASRDCVHMDVGLYAVRVGDTHMYGDRHSTKEETYNISIKNVYGCGAYAIALAGKIGNLVMDNIACGDNTELLLDQRS